MEIINAVSDTLYIDQFSTLPGQAWCILGTNLSGMEDFFTLVSGRPWTGRADRLDLPQGIETVSFKDQQEIYETELKNDETDFMDQFDPGTPAQDFLGDTARHASLIDALGMGPCLDRGFRTLSTGQARKLLLLSPITRNASFLVIQAPFDGLDAHSCTEMSTALELLHRQGIGILIFVHNRGDIPDWATHLGMVSGGRLCLKGPRQQVLPEMDRALQQASPDFRATATDFARGGTPGRKKELVRLRKGAAGYGGRKVFRGVDLEIRQGDHTLISGPNGCGKSTLVQVITGDHPACYRNDLHVFGKKRGSGESVWELKRHMGIVSADLHRNYRVPGSTLSCILSGLFDSVGLYQGVTPLQEQGARDWLDRLGMGEKDGVPFRDLEYGAQRLVLIARAMIKRPGLLVLDEPTQGIDELNRHAVLDFLEGLAKENLSTILYVSHRQDEFRSFFRQHLKMKVIK